MVVGLAPLKRIPKCGLLRERGRGLPAVEDNACYVTDELDNLDEREGWEELGKKREMLVDGLINFSFHVGWRFIRRMFHSRRVAYVKRARLLPATPPLASTFNRTSPSLSPASSTTSSSVLVLYTLYFVSR